MDQNSRIPSLRRQMALIILLCWLLPVVIAASAVGWYVLSGTGRGKEEALSQQFQPYTFWLTLEAFDKYPYVFTCLKAHGLNLLTVLWLLPVCRSGSQPSLPDCCPRC